MNEYVNQLVQKYRKKGLLIDTNLLLLYFVGVFDEDVIADFKRTEKYIKDDYYLLINLLDKIQPWVTLPNILTEVSNLSNQLAGNKKDEYFTVFAKGITVLEEHYLESREIAKTQEFKKFGITDAGIKTLAPQKYLILTDDFRLSQYLEKQKIDVINLNHLRFN